MLAAILKLYALGTAVTVFAVILRALDSFGGLVYVQGNMHAATELSQHQMEVGVTPSSNQRRSAVVKSIGT